MSVTINGPVLDGREEAGLLSRLRRRKGPFAIVFVLVMSLFAALFAITPPAYLAAGAVIVTSYSQQLNQQLSPAAEQKLGDPADMDGQIIVLQSPRVLEEMLRRPDVVRAVDEDCELARRSSPINGLRSLLRFPPKSCEAQLAGGGMLDWLHDKLSVGVAGRSRVIQIGYRSSSPAIAATLVNSLIDAYVAQGSADKQQSSARAAAWVHSELDRIGGELHQSEIEIEKFRREHSLVRGQTAAIDSERLTQVSAQLAAAQATWSDAGAKLEQLRGGASDARQTLDSRTVADLKQKLTEVNASIAYTASFYGAGYPALAALQKQSNDITRRITDETNRIRSSSERDFDSAGAQVAALRKQLDDMKRDVSVGDFAETQIASMVRDNDVRRELYLDLSKKVNDLEAQLRLVSGDVQLVNYATVPDKVAWPKLPLFVMAGLFLSIILSSAVALILDRSDSSVRTSGRLETLSDIPVVGRIPYVRRLQRSYVRTNGAQLGQPSTLQESIRSLYTKSILLGGSTRPRTLLVTSASPSEGKSLLTLAMAEFGASMGQRVLAVEGDMRRPGFRSTLGLSEGPGLVELLRGKLAYDQAVRRTDLGFDIVLAGSATVASTELLTNGRIDAFLEWARGRYDLVLIDSPPAQILMDAHVIAGRVDGVLCCVRWGYTSIDSVVGTLRGLRQAGGRVIGVVLGMVKPERYGLYEPAALPSRPYLIKSA